jgi:hypothetical protein
LLGILIGLAAGAWGFRYFYTHTWTKKDPTQFFLKKLDRELKLTVEQRAKVGEILAAKKAQMDSLGAETRPKFEGVRKQGEQEIRALLTPDQASQFDLLLKKMEKRRSGKPWGRGPHPRPGMDR